MHSLDAGNNMRRGEPSRGVTAEMAEQSDGKGNGIGMNKGGI